MASDRYPDGFSWNKKTRRFRDKKTGRFIKDKTVIDLRNRFIDSQLQTADDLGKLLADGEITLRKWEAEMWTHIRTTYNAEFMAGRGGINAITKADRTALGRILKEQRAYLRGFAESIANGNLTLKQITARSKLYIHSATQAYERGKARAWDIRLPAYPGDGTTKCMANCKCHWEITEKVDRVQAFWRMSAVENCADCVTRAIRWSPYTIFR